MLQKRGQASIFLVLALVLLIIGAFYFYSQRASEKTIGISEPQAISARNFIESCIQEVSDRAFRIAGINGGYISFPAAIENDPRTYLQFGPLENVKIPYWWYDGKNAVPSEGFVVQQIEDYIGAHLDACIQDLSEIRNFDAKKLGPVEATVTLNAEDVTVDVEYPLELTFGENQTRTELREFQIRLPIRFKKIYEFSTSIMDAENENFFLEEKTMDLIVLDKDIPTTDMEASCEEKVWLLHDIEQKVRRLLSTNLAYVNVVGSEFSSSGYVPNPFGDNTYEDSYFNTHYLWAVSDASYEDTKVSVEYDERWPLYLYVRPSREGILRSRPQQGQDTLKFFCLNIWHFTYDLTYPVKVTVTDEKGINPYQFSFAFEVNVDHNRPERENVPRRAFEAVESSQEEAYCNDRVHDVTIFTIANATNEADIPDANITFTCGIYSCNIGQSDWLSFGAAAGITEKFPFCNNGIVRAKKEGFMNAEMFIQTEQPGAYNLYMTPIKEFPDFDVVKHDFDSPLLEKRLDELDTASINLKSTKTDFETFSVFPNAGGLPITILQESHEYEVTLFLSNGDSIVGGYEGTWTVNKDELEDADRIKFHVLEHSGSEEERFLFIQGLQSYSSRVPEPELI